MAALNLHRDHAALLVVDMETDFVYGPMAVTGAPELARRLAPVLRAARAAHLPLIFANQTLRPGGADTGNLDRFDPVRDGLALQEGTPGVEVVADLEPSPDDLYIVKRRFSAFHATDLDLLLRSRSITQLLVCGVAAHVCCDITTRDASQLGYDTVYLTDGVEMSDLPDHGFGSIPAAQAKAVIATTIAHRFGTLGTLDELLSKLTE